MPRAPFLLVPPLIVISLACGGGADTGAWGDGPPPWAEYDEPSADVDSFARYSASRYDYCDAMVLSHAWGMGPGDAKLLIGEKLGWGGEAAVDAAIEAAAATASRQSKITCTWDMAGYSFEDMAALAAMWGIDTWDAKTRASEKLSWGSRGMLADAVREARFGP